MRISGNTALGIEGKPSGEQPKGRDPGTQRTNPRATFRYGACNVSIRQAWDHRAR
jgi:hypothetical protein